MKQPPNYIKPKEDEYDNIINTCQDCSHSSYSKRNKVNNLTCNLHNTEVHINAVCDDLEPLII